MDEVKELNKCEIQNEKTKSKSLDSVDQPESIISQNVKVDHSISQVKLIETEAEDGNSAELNEDTKSKAICENVKRNEILRDQQPEIFKYVFAVTILILGIYFGKCLGNSSGKELKGSETKSILNIKENSDILERLLEYKDICKDLEIFTRQIVVYNDNDNEQQNVKEINSEEITSSGNDDDDCLRIPIKAKKSKLLPKSTAINGKKFLINSKYHKHNKSIKNKFHKKIVDKKDGNINKKNSTAEPIIYLFALVFIYLLLRAASDINQHYKSQNKNDKRLRRFSLQSYAQAHKPDRRASKVEKDLDLRLKQHRLMYSMSRHVMSQDVSPQSSTKQALNMPPPSFGTVMQAPDLHRNALTNWHLIRHNMASQSLDIADEGAKSRSEYCLNRRGSVPASFFNIQRSKFSSLSEHTSSMSLDRRTSITGPNINLFKTSMDSSGSIHEQSEGKRRVRMINRH